MVIAKYFKTVAQACRYTGAKGELVFVLEDCSLRIHDGCTCGGKSATGLSADEVKAIVDTCLVSIIDRIVTLEETPDNFIDNGMYDPTSGNLFLNDVLGNTLQFNIPQPPLEQGLYVDGTQEPIVDVDGGTITLFTLFDVDETDGPELVIDISALITALTSTDHPEFNFEGNLSGTFDTVTNTWTITGVDTDTIDPDTDTRTTITKNANGNLVITTIDVLTGDVIETKTLGLPQSIQCGIDGNCVPTPTDASVAGIYFNKEGDTFHYDPVNGMQKQNVNACSERVNATLIPTITLSDADLAAIPIDTETVIGTVKLFIDNPWECEAAIYAGIARTVVALTGKRVGQNGFIEMGVGFRTGAGNTVQFTGTSLATYDNFGFPVDTLKQIIGEPHIIRANSLVPANFGQRCLSLEVVINIKEYTSDPDNVLRVGTTFHRGEIHRGGK